MKQDFDRLFREAMVHFYDHLRYLSRRGYELDVEGEKAIITRRDQALRVTVPLATLKDRRGFSRLGF